MSDAIPISIDDDDEQEQQAIDPSQAIPTGSIPVSGASAAGPAIPTDQSPGQAIPTDGSPSVDHRAGVAKLWSRADNIHNPVLRVLGKIGAGMARGIDIAGSIAAPGIASEIPGSTLNNAISIRKEKAQEKEDSEESLQAATAGHLNAETAALKNPPAKAKEEEWSVIPGMVGPNGEPVQQEKNSGQIRFAQDVTGVGPLKPAADKQTPAHVSYDAGIPVSVTGADGNVYDVNDPKMPPELKPLVDSANRAHGTHVQEAKDVAAAGASRAATNRSATESAQVERESRQTIRKSEGQYRDTQKSVSQLTSAIDQAKDGNGLLTSFVPTMEVLGINASQGVHRISPAEAQAASLPGGWAERFNAFFDKATTGKLSPELVSEGKQLAKILKDSSYQRYKSTYDDESGIVSGYGGTDFNKRVPLIPPDQEQEQQGGGGAGPQRPSNVPADFVFKANGPKGKGWYRP